MQITRKQNFIFEDIDPLLGLAEVEGMLKESRVFRTIPSRPTLIEYCEDGTFDSIVFRGRHMVYESSVLRFIEGLQRPRLRAA